MKKFNLFKMLAVLIVLITCINTAWATNWNGQGANAGFNSTDGVEVEFTVNGSSVKRTISYSSAGGEASLGDVTSGIELTAFEAKTWKNTSYGNICSVGMYYKVKNSEGTTVYDKTSSATNATSSTNIDNNGNQKWTKSGINDNLLNGGAGLDPGTYTFECWFVAAGSNSTTNNCDYDYFWYNNNYDGVDYHYTYTFNVLPKVNFSVSPAGAASNPTNDAGISSGDGVSIGTNVVFTHAEANDGYQWSHWENGSGGSLGTGNTYTASSISDNITIVAVYTENDYEVSVASSSADAGSVASSNVTGHVSTSADLPDATPNKGYYFVNWEVTSGTAVITNSTSATTATINGMTGDVTVRANFASIWAVVGGDTGSGDGDHDKMGDWAVDNHLFYKETNASSEDIYEGTIYLAADSTYFFKIKKCDNNKWYGMGYEMVDRLGFIGQSGYSHNGLGEENSTQYQVVRIMTAEEGYYTFTFNNSTKKLAITYPTVTHPTSHYVYFKYTESWNANYITAHVWTRGEDTQTGFHNLHAVNTCTFAGNTYYYAALGNESYCLFASLDNTGNKTEDLATAASNKGKYYDVTSGDSEAARWNTFDVTVALDNQSATTAGAASVTATYNAAMPSIESNKPSKTGYSFQGYFKEVAGGSTQYYTDAGASAHVWDQTGANPSIYAKWTQRVTLHDNKNGLCNGYVDVVYNANAVVAAPTAPTLASCHVVGYYAEEACTNKVMEANGTLVEYTDYVDAEGKWIHSGPTTLYAKWESTNFVIYRPGDKDEDNRSIDDQVESFAGGTIDKTIEYRMKVRDIDTWYALSIPFTVNEVKVWDDAGWHDIFPYYRPVVGGTYYQGYYVLRTPRDATGLPISDFSDWRDPMDFNAKPAKNTPYIILWHLSYFEGKYVSFFGASGQTIPNAMTVGTAPTADGVLNIYGNDAMTSGSVQDGYTYVGDYGGGAWLRNETKGTYRTVPAFECYIRANGATTDSNLAIKRRTGDDTTTDWDDVLNSEYKEVITVYTISGLRVAQYTDCSIAEAGRRMNAELSEGIYILSAGNESVKIMIGGK